MNEDQLLASLARLCGDITLTHNDAGQVEQLQQALAGALINHPSLTASDPFQHQQAGTGDQRLEPATVKQLSQVVQKLQASAKAMDPSLQVFRREVPLVSSQVKGSVPEWGRGGQIERTIGPIRNNEGRRIWFDLYRTIPVVQVWLQGAPRPFLLLPLQVQRLAATAGTRKYRIPQGSVWIHAGVFAPASPDNLYCGLAVQGGEIEFSASLSLAATNTLVVPVGMQAAITLNLAQKTVTDGSPDNHGIDVKEAAITLPGTLSLTVSHTVRTVKAGDAKWRLYGQDMAFSQDSTKPARWVPERNRIALPYQTDAAALQIQACKSPLCTLEGKAAIAGGAWSLPAAAVSLTAPVQADGTGALEVAVTGGLEVSWPGLKDAALYQKTAIRLLNALVMLMPGRLTVSTLFASGAGSRQRYRLWQEPPEDGIEKPVQYIDLSYTKQFFFFYDSQQSGTETVSAQANCTGSINKPVQVTGSPFKLESLQTIFALSRSQALQLVMLYDDNILHDNWSKTVKPVPGTPLPPVSFRSTAMALNNALLTVSPLYSILLYGDLKDDDSFDSCLLLFSYGLLQYLPTLPDPYAANVSLLRRRSPNRDEAEKGHRLTDINALLVGLLHWKGMNEPDIRFFFGDRPANPQSGQPAALAVSQPQALRLGDLKNPEVLDKVQQAALQRTTALQVRNWQSVTDSSEESTRMVTAENHGMMAANRAIAEGRTSPFRNAFTLLDVSTNADLMGLSLAFANDDFIFRKTHLPKEEITGSPLSINGLDVQAVSRLVQVYALPQISWEPMISLSEITNYAQDPYPGILYFLNDGIPAQIANTGNEPVTLSPLPLTEKITGWYNEKGLPLWSLFTLSNGMLAVALYLKNGDGTRPVVELINESFSGALVDKTFTEDLHTGLQIKTVGFWDEKNEHKKFLGSAHQLSNVNNLNFPGTNGRSVLSGSVTEIFNDEFGALTGFDLNKYLPLERYDFSGYGANVFSHWVNRNAALAQTSQAMFDVWRGRTAHEVIQVKSVLYPWAIRVVRTITIYRGSNGMVWRTDSGWKAESDGIYDFRTPVKDHASDSQQLKDAKAQEKARTYVFHPGMVEGLFNVRNIKEDTTLAPFTTTWNKTSGVYIDDQGHPAVAPAPQPLEVKLVPVYFDADVKIDDVTQGATDGRVLGQRLLGYLQLRPRGVFIDAEDFANLLTLHQGLGGPVDCTVNIHGSGQAMRISRVEVNPGRDGANNRVFVVAAKGTPVLPKDGSWSVVEHDAATKEVRPLSGNEVIPLVRQGERIFPDIEKLTYSQNKAQDVAVAHATELFKALESRALQYGFLQSTGENKVLFRNPQFQKGLDTLKGSIPDLADAYRLMNSKGIFPKLEDLPKITEMGGDFALKIKEEGYKLLNQVDPTKLLEQALPPGPWYIVKTNDVKVYVEYKSTDGNGATKDAKLNLDIDSTAKKWLNKMNDISMFVDLGSFSKLLVIRGKFDTEKGKSPAFIEPVMEFGPQLKPVYEILVLLSQLAVNPDYKDILKKGLKIAMSNSPNNWEYKFQADKEIPVLRFPPPSLDSPTAPLRLEANLKAGVYFNVGIPLPPTNGIQAPSAGAFVEFYGKLSVMCVSVAAATVYAVGQATVRISADTVIGPALYMKFGFGVEVMVGLPVIGSVSVYFAAGVELSLDSTQVTIAGFILFRGRAEIFGGIVTVTIMIEASGKVQDRIGGAGGQTYMEAQVTFSLDISICFIIDISFTEQWKEKRQIA